MSGGLKVDFGFSPYSERINGRIAMLGLTALVAVELATGKGVINYHTPAIVLIQVYFVAAVSALFVKYEKERPSQLHLSIPEVLKSQAVLAPPFYKPLDHTDCQFLQQHNQYHCLATTPPKPSSLN